MSSNPYSDNDPQSPYAFQSQAPIGYGYGNGNGYIKQIPVVGILNIVQASLELMICIMVIGIAIFMRTMPNDLKLQKIPNAPPMEWIAIGYFIFGAVIGVIATLRLVGGIMILKKRGRILSIVASVLGLATVFTCYCSLTSIALCVYSLVVLIQPSVIEEFDRARA